MLPRSTPFLHMPSEYSKRKKPTRRREVVLSGVLCPSRPVEERCRWTGLLGPGRCDNSLVPKPGREGRVTNSERSVDSVEQIAESDVTEG